MKRSNIMTNAKTIETASFRDNMLAFTKTRVDTMVKKINDSLDRRDTFETLHNASEADNSWSRAAKAMRKSSDKVARFFLALGVQPENVIERQVVSNKMFNAKALDKVTELAIYANGDRSKLQKVTRAFIACALIATDKSISVITNEINRRFLCSAGFSAQISDQELLDHLDEMRHRSMSSGAETQSSQARNVLDVLGLGDIVTHTRSRDAIIVHAEHDFFAQFRSDYMVKVAPSVTVDAALAAPKSKAKSKSKVAAPVEAATDTQEQDVASLINELITA
jgi:hypothetical protein